MIVLLAAVILVAGPLVLMVALPWTTWPPVSCARASAGITAAAAAAPRMEASSPAHEKSEAPVAAVREERGRCIIGLLARRHWRGTHITPPARRAPGSKGFRTGSCPRNGRGCRRLSCRAHPRARTPSLLER